VRIETRRLVIRSCEAKDAEGLYPILTDPEVRRFLPPSPIPTHEQARERIAARLATEAERGYAIWAVELRDGELIGQCGLQPVERTKPEIELAYHYKPSSWHKGFGTEAAIAVLGYGLHTLGLERIIAICFSENVGSWRIMEKAGMRSVGLADYYGVVGLKKYVADRETWQQAA
jgi:ribosomal-protein-alanine N-acetyltransferase